MLHPSYSDLMKVVNADVEPGEAPIVNSRYSIVMATSKRARQIVSGDEAMVDTNRIKPLSMAVDEMSMGKIKILTEDEAQKAREVMAAELLVQAEKAAQAAEEALAAEAAQAAEDALAALEEAEAKEAKARAKAEAQAKAAAKAEAEAAVAAEAAAAETAEE